MKKVIKDNIVHSGFTFLVRCGFLYFRTEQVRVYNIDLLYQGIAYALRCERDDIFYQAPTVYAPPEINETEDLVNCMACLAAEVR